MKIDRFGQFAQGTRGRLTETRSFCVWGAGVQGGAAKRGVGRWHSPSELVGIGVNEGMIIRAGGELIGEVTTK